jgi:chromosome partitioning protein
MSAGVGWPTPDGESQTRVGWPLAYRRRKQDGFDDTSEEIERMPDVPSDGDGPALTQPDLAPTNADVSESASGVPEAASVVHEATAEAIEAAGVVVTGLPNDGSALWGTAADSSARDSVLGTQTSSPRHLFAPIAPLDEQVGPSAAEPSTGDGATPEHAEVSSGWVPAIDDSSAQDSAPVDPLFVATQAADNSETPDVSRETTADDSPGQPPGTAKPQPTSSSTDVDRSASVATDAWARAVTPHDVSRETAVTSPGEDPRLEPGGADKLPPVSEPAYAVEAARAATTAGESDRSASAAEFGGATGVLPGSEDIRPAVSPEAPDVSREATSGPVANPSAADHSSDDVSAVRPGLNAVSRETSAPTDGPAESSVASASASGTSPESGAATVAPSTLRQAADPAPSADHRSDDAPGNVDQVSRETTDGADVDLEPEATNHQGNVDAQGTEAPPVSRETTERIAGVETTVGAVAVADDAAESVSRETEPSEPPPSPLLAGTEWAVPATRRVIAIANQKGGVGKTTSTVNLAAALGAHGVKVLVIDLDPQGNASTALSVPHKAQEPSIYEVLIGDMALIDVAVAVEDMPNVWCAPATIDLAGAEIELVSVVARESRLKKAIDSIGDAVDYVFIDCPPSLGLLTLNAMMAATEILIPIQCEFYALEGLTQLLNNVELVKSQLNPELYVSTILLTMYDGRTKLADQVAAEVRAHFGELVLDAVIPRSVRVSEAPGFGQTVVAFDPTSRGAMAYIAAAYDLTVRSE